MGAGEWLAGVKGTLTGGLRTAAPEGAGAGSPPARRRLASVSERRLASASCARRASSSCLRASAAARSSRSRPSRSSRILASASARLRSSTSRSRAPERARDRASRSSSVSERKITPDAARCGCCGWAGAACGRALGAGGAGGGGAAATSRGGACVSPGATARRFTFSTTTAFERPCEKLWRTIPASTGRFKVSFLAGATLNVVSPGFLVSFISITFPGPRPFDFMVPDVQHFQLHNSSIRLVRFRSARLAGAFHPRRSGQVKRQLLAALQKPFTCGSFEQSRMYHICASQCQIQLAGRK